jgi:hypothetical protein
MEPAGFSLREPGRTLSTEVSSGLGEQTVRVWGVVSLGVLLMTWLAGDDITTDDATTFPLEYVMLVCAAVWFAVLGVALARRGRVVAGVASLAAVGLGVAACWNLPHHDQPFSPINGFVYVTLAWFLGLAIRLVARPFPAPSPGGGVR